LGNIGQSGELDVGKVIKKQEKKRVCIMDGKEQTWVISNATGC
jgi:hypothetical protein